MRTRMYGGVRGQGLAAPIYSIFALLMYHKGKFSSDMVICTSKRTPLFYICISPRRSKIKPFLIGRLFRIQTVYT